MMGIRGIEAISVRSIDKRYATAHHFLKNIERFSLRRPILDRQGHGPIAQYADLDACFSEEASAHGEDLLQ